MAHDVVALYIRDSFDASLLELVMSQMLNIAIYADTPLLQLSNDTLLVLGRHASNIRLRAGVLKTYHVSVLGPHLLQTLHQLLSLHLVVLLVNLIVKLVHGLQINLPRAQILILSFLQLNLSQKLDNRLHGVGADFHLRHVGPIKAVDAIGSKDASLILQHSLFLASLRHIEAKLVLDVADLFH